MLNESETFWRFQTALFSEKHWAWDTFLCEQQMPFLCSGLFTSTVYFAVPPLSWIFHQGCSTNYFVKTKQIPSIASTTSNLRVTDPGSYFRNPFSACLGLLPRISCSNPSPRQLGSTCVVPTYGMFNAASEKCQNGKTRTRWKTKITTFQQWLCSRRLLLGL